ncbi:MAG: polysaccharide biosynthesis/export family protein [Limisphaerales bacterium]
MCGISSRLSEAIVRNCQRFFLSFLLLAFFSVLNSASLLADPPSPPASAGLASGTNATRAELESILSSLTNNTPIELTNPIEPLDDKYKLAIGDRLSFKILEDGEDSKPLQVTDSGDIEFPYIGRVPVTGKTCQQLSDELKTQFEKDYYKQATVIVAVDVKARSLGKVYLVGPVGAPGPQDIPSDEEFTLSKAILRAGGFTDFADQHSVRVTRKQPGQGAASNQTFIVDVGKILKNGKTDLDIVLESGDLIFVREKMIRF